MATKAAEQRRLRVMFVILGVLVVVLVARLLMGGGGGDGDGATSDPSATTTTVPVAAPPESPVIPVEDDETFDVFASRNPFEPVTGGVTPGNGLADDVDDDFPTGTTPDFPDNVPTNTAPTTQPGAPASPTTNVATFDPQRQMVTLIDIYDAAGAYRASVQVDGLVSDVGVGESFADRYRVVSLDAQCGQFLYGDAPFRLCEGEQIIK